jgi:hypothetical protein
MNMKLALLLIVATVANAKGHEGSDNTGDNSKKHSNTGVVGATSTSTTTFSSGHTNFAVSGARGSEGSKAGNQMETEKQTAVEKGKGGKTADKETPEENSHLLFYAAGGALVVVGFLLYSGGGNKAASTPEEKATVLVEAQSL